MASFEAWRQEQKKLANEMLQREEAINREVIELFELQGVVSAEVPENQITLTSNPYYRFGYRTAPSLSDSDSKDGAMYIGSSEDIESRCRTSSCIELISYAIGCMMGRYRLDRPGLIYAHAGNERFWDVYDGVVSDQCSVVSKSTGTDHSPLTTDHSPADHSPGTAVVSDQWTVDSKSTDADHSSLTTDHCLFPPDQDGILPITAELWFEDDAANRIREFLLAVWPEKRVVSDQGSVNSEKRPADHWPLATDHSAPDHSNLDANMRWLAESLGQKGSETPEETLRRYVAGRFFKDHLQTYKKRPIYWLFSSGKQGAFQALVYLHRYHEGTLARMRAEYVVPLTGKLQGRIAMLEKDRAAAPSAAARSRIGKQVESLKKQHLELLAYDEKLRHYADMRISLDLDDGVKVNYGKFGDLLAEVKAVTGGVED